jgi:hypothetical protein
MKKIFFILLLICMAVIGEAQTRKVARRSMIELGPKTSLYLGSLRFGFGAELLVNPLQNAALRVNLTELSFGDGGTRFHFNLRDISIDGILYLPMQGIEPYAFLGLGVAANGSTDVDFRGGMGLNFPITRGTNVFIEPGAIISYDSYSEETDIWFRLSLGGRFALIR